MTASSYGHSIFFCLSGFTAIRSVGDINGLGDSAAVVVNIFDCVDIYTIQFLFFKTSKTNGLGGKRGRLCLKSPFFFSKFSKRWCHGDSSPLFEFPFPAFCFFICLGNPRSHQRDVLEKAQKRYTFAQDLLFRFYSG